MKTIDTDFAVKCLIKTLFEKGVINSATYFNIIKNEFRNKTDDNTKGMVA